MIEKMLVNSILGQLRRIAKHAAPELGKIKKMVFVFEKIGTKENGKQMFRFEKSDSEVWKEMDEEDKTQIKKLIPVKIGDMKTAVFELNFEDREIKGQVCLTDGKEETYNFSGR